MALPEAKNEALEMESDEQIMQRVMEGDSEAFGTLVDRYHARLVSYFAHQLPTIEDAQDAYQELWLKVYRAANQFDTSQSFYTWLFTIASRTCSDCYRKQARQSSVISLAASEQDSHLAMDVFLEDKTLVPIPEQIAKRELSNRSRSAVWQLPPKVRDAFMLVCMYEQTQEKAATSLHTSAASINRRVAQAKTLLRAILTGNPQSAHPAGGRTRVALRERLDRGVAALEAPRSHRGTSPKSLPAA